MTTIPTPGPTPATGNQKPSLTGVRNKQRKGVAKANAKFEPEIFRDALLSLLPPAPASPDVVATKLITAGTTLEYLKYADQFFELLLVGGLLQPGGSYIDKEEEALRSSFAIVGGIEEMQGLSLGADADKKAIIEEVKIKVDVYKKVVQRYKYLQKPLEKNVLPALVQYINKWSPLQREKIAYAAGLIIAQGFSSLELFQNLTKEHLLKDSVSLNFLTDFCRGYLSAMSQEHLLKVLKAAFKDLLDVFPAGQKNRAALEAHFKSHGMGFVGEWYTKRVATLVKEEMSRFVVGSVEEDDAYTEEWNENILANLTATQKENSIPSTEVVALAFNAFMSTLDWSGSKEQYGQVKSFGPILAPFCKKPMEQVTLLQVIQVYCYDEQKAMKAFPSLVRIFWDLDLVSDAAVQYWYEKGAKNQGKEFFLKSVQPLYEHITASDDEDDDE